MERYAITRRPAAPEITVSSQVLSQGEESWLSLTVRHVSLHCASILHLNRQAHQNTSMQWFEQGAAVYVVGHIQHIPV